MEHEQDPGWACATSFVFRFGASLPFSPGGWAGVTKVGSGRSGRGGQLGAGGCRRGLEMRLEEPWRVLARSKHGGPRVPPRVSFCSLFPCWRRVLEITEPGGGDAWVRDRGCER